MKLKKILASVMALSILTTSAAIASTTASAAGTTINPTAKGTVTIEKWQAMRGGNIVPGNDDDSQEASNTKGEGLNGIYFAIKKVYDWKSPQAVITANGGTDPLDIDPSVGAYPANLNLTDARNVAGAAPTYDNTTKALTGTTGWKTGVTTGGTASTAGSVKFTDLPIGVYLVEEIVPPSLSNYKGNAFIITVPMSGTNSNNSISGSQTEWTYDYTVTAKNKASFDSITLTKVSQEDVLTKIQGAYFWLYMDPNGDTTYNVATGTYANNTDDVRIEAPATSNTKFTEANLTTAADGTLTINGLAPGYYYFVEQTSAGLAEDYIVEKTPKFVKTANATGTGSSSYAATNGQLQVSNYDPADTLTKTSATPDGNDVLGTPVGATDNPFVTYTITTKLPTNIRELSDYTIVDTLPAGLTHVNDVAVKIGATALDAAEVVTTYAGQVLTIAFQPAELGDKNNQTVTITYTAKANNGIQTVNTNTAVLTYNNDPYVAASKDTTSVNDNVYSGKIVINKKDEDGNAVTSGTAKYKIYQLIGDTKTYVQEVNATAGIVGDLVLTTVNGTVSWIGLETGNYYLEEIQAPDGYQLLTQDIPFTVSAGTTDTALTVTVEPGNNTVSDLPLPLTGGTGTLIFTIVGLALIGTAGALFIVAKKRRAN